MNSCGTSDERNIAFWSLRVTMPPSSATIPSSSVRNLLGQVFDIRLHPRAVLLGKACCRSYPGEHVPSCLPLRGRSPCGGFRPFREYGVGGGAEQERARASSRMTLAECQCHVASHGVPYERTAPDAQSREGVGYRVGQEIHRMHFACDDRKCRDPAGRASLRVPLYIGRGRNPPIPMPIRDSRAAARHTCHRPANRRHAGP